MDKSIRMLKSIRIRQNRRTPPRPALLLTGGFWVSTASSSICSASTDLLDGPPLPWRWRHPAAQGSLGGGGASSLKQREKGKELQPKREAARPCSPPSRAALKPASVAMREIVHLQAGQCGNQIGAKVKRGCALGRELKGWERMKWDGVWHGYLQVFKSLCLKCADALFQCPLVCVHEIDMFFKSLFWTFVRTVVHLAGEFSRILM